MRPIDRSAEATSPIRLVCSFFKRCEMEVFVIGLVVVMIVLTVVVLYLTTTSSDKIVDDKGRTHIEENE